MDSKDLVLVPRKLQVATFLLQLAILVILLLHLLAAWGYKSRWLDLNSRVQRLENPSSVREGTTTPTQRR